MMSNCHTNEGLGVGQPVRHIPVLCAAVLEALQPRNGGRYVDGTFGAGGHSGALLAAADCRVLGIDRDPSVFFGPQPLSEIYGSRLVLAQARFRDMEVLARHERFAPADGVLLDLGVSSMQLDEGARGFSFQKDGPLDMRMSRSGLSAADLVNTLDEGALADILFHLGEERRARAIARAVVAARRKRPFKNTLRLANLVAEVLGGRREVGKHPATRTFQALRLAVNGELVELAHGLAAAERLLKPGGRLAVITFHSLEDRIVKRFFAQRSGLVNRPSRHMPDVAPAPEASFTLVTRKPLRPDEAEVGVNPRARSAKLRVGERTHGAPHALDLAALGVPELPPFAR